MAEIEIYGLIESLYFGRSLHYIARSQKPKREKHGILAFHSG